MKSTKKATCALRRVLLLILILSLALTGCRQEEIYADEYPNWYYGSIFDPQSSEYGKPLVTYQTLSDVLKTVDENGKLSNGFYVRLIYDDIVLNKLIEQKATFKLTLIYYDIIGDQPPQNKQSTVIMSLRNGEDPEVFGGSLSFQSEVHLPVTRWNTNAFGVIAMRMDFNCLDVGDSTWYQHIYYAKQGGDVYLFKTYGEFYNYQLKMGGV